MRGLQLHFACYDVMMQSYREDMAKVIYHRINKTNTTTQHHACDRLYFLQRYRKIWMRANPIMNNYGLDTTTNTTHHVCVRLPEAMSQSECATASAGSVARCARCSPLASKERHELLCGKIVAAARGTALRPRGRPHGRAGPPNTRGLVLWTNRHHHHQ